MTSELTMPFVLHMFMRLIRRLVSMVYLVVVEMGMGLCESSFSVVVLLNTSWRGYIVWTPRWRGNIIPGLLTLSVVESWSTQKYPSLSNCHLSRGRAPSTDLSTRASLTTCREFYR